MGALKWRKTCADAMVALGLLERDGPLYRNGAVAGAYLTGRGAGDLRPFVIESVTAGSAVALADSYEFGQHRRLLDLGGGTGSFLVRILNRYPAIECGLFELPHVIALARANLNAQAPGGSVRFYEGDLLRDQLPTGYDVFLLANVIHTSHRTTTGIC